MPGDIFTQFPLFNGFTPEQLDVLRSVAVPVDGYAGTLLFRQDEPAENLYLVLVGEVLIHYKPEDGPPITIARIHPGGVVGWSTLVRRQEYTSSAECAVYSQFLRLSREALDNLHRKHPEISRLLTDRLAESVAARQKGSRSQMTALLESSLRQSTR